MRPCSPLLAEFRSCETLQVGRPAGRKLTEKVHMFLETVTTEWTIPSANSVSRFPIAQQIVGLTTVASNLAKVIQDLALLLFQSIVYTFDRLFPPKKTIPAYSLDSPPTGSTNFNPFVEWTPPCNVEKRGELEAVSALQQSLLQLRLHCYYIGIGCIRMCPLVGSWYSISEYRKETQGIEVFRGRSQTFVNAILESSK